MVDGVPDAVTSSILARLGLSVCRCAPDDLDVELDDVRTVAVLAPAADGVSLAQQVHRSAPDAFVALFADDAEQRDAVTSTLVITPRIGRHTRCLDASDPDTEPLVAEEIGQASRRTEHRRTMQRVRGVLDDLSAVTADQASRYLGQIFGLAPIGILIAGGDGVVKAANPGIEEVLGWLPHHAVGDELAVMFSGEDAQRARELVAECADDGTSTTETLLRTGPDGSAQHVEVRTAPVDPEHPELGVIVVLRDESDRVRSVEFAERAREAAEAAAERYASLARTLQESLLPPDLPQVDGVELAALFHPAGDGSQIGGDFYDLFPLTDTEWFGVLGDVCGKGAGAARLTALARYTLRAAAIRSTDLRRNLGELNRALIRQSDDDRRRHSEHRFVTAAAMRFWAIPDGVAVRAGIAGHPLPLVIRPDGSVDDVECSGPLLGVFDEVDHEICELELAPGEVLVVFTDGVTEARRGDELFGDDRLAALLRSMAGRSAGKVVDAIAQAVLGFQEGVARDDIAVLAIGAPTVSVG